MNKLIYLFLSIITMTFFSNQSRAQDSTTFPFDNGVIVAIKSRTIPPASVQELDKLYYESGSYNSKDISSILRTYTNDEEKVIFAYGIEIKPNEDGKTFNISFTSRKAFRIQYDDKKSNKKYDNSDYIDKTLSNYPSNITVNDGDTIVLDILENPKTGGKIQDLIKITREKKPFDNYFDELKEPSDFSIDDIALQLYEYKLYINGKSVERSYKNNTRSKFVGFEFNKYGALVLTATPIIGYGFQKLGVVDGYKLNFEFNGDKFEIVSTVPILGLGKKWNLWVLNPPRQHPDYIIPDNIGFITRSLNKIEDFFDDNKKESENKTNKMKMIFNMPDIPKPSNSPKPKEN